MEQPEIEEPKEKKKEKTTKGYLKDCGLALIITYGGLEVVTFEYSFNTFCAVYLGICFLMFKWF
jgi:hypothetical protein